MMAIAMLTELLLEAKLRDVFTNLQADLKVNNDIADHVRCPGSAELCSNCRDANCHLL